MARAGMERWRHRLALVTGASGGIGAAVARALVQQGLKVVGCARTVGNIEELAAECKSAGYPGTLIPYRCDLSSEEDILSMFSAVRSQHNGVDICINNAGLARPDTLLSGSTSGWKDMFNVNVLALSICTREAYQSMKERNVDDGHIININRPWDEPYLMAQRKTTHALPSGSPSLRDMASACPQRSPSRTVSVNTNKMERFLISCMTRRMYSECILWSV
ncbi:PREDICTED: dehydrogenase/reductase SDR family member 11 isoform X3 [Galeopterus variegatus]|uniref:Dehydrogenase/reductase SDR family member 11 isoform X3 n=1 Tax=Galeopterus variegatus TaxID=482537 RepID=A0ABM0R7Y8_GALVR|nr:PREDICTED: dehydrogenase/reductase SDR family member 11 isoform X3 [Galeopterus variegatus]